MRKSAGPGPRKVCACAVQFLLVGVLGLAGGTTIAPPPPAAGEGTSLPDGRVYEQVSTPTDEEAYVPERGNDAPEDILTSRPFRAASDGSAIAYLADAPSSGEGGSSAIGGGAGNQYLATRTAAGWTTRDISAPGSTFEARYEAFSSDLSLGIFHSLTADPRLAPTAPLGCSVLYAHGDGEGGFAPLFTTAQVAGGCREEESKLYAGASSDGGRLFFQSS